MVNHDGTLPATGSPHTSPVLKFPSTTAGEHLGEASLRVLIDESAVRQGVERLAREIISDYEPRPLTILGVMTGSLVLLADLIRQLDLQIRVGVIQASSYRGGTVRGELVIDDRWMPEIEGHEGLLVDDIFDTGHTLDKIVERIRVRQPKSIRSAVLLTKLGRSEVQIKPDYSVFEIPDEFVVGYGLDYQDEYRHLPHIAVLEAADLA